MFDEIESALEICLAVMGAAWEYETVDGRKITVEKALTDLRAWREKIPGELAEAVKFHPEMDEPIVKAAALLSQANERKE